MSSSKPKYLWATMSRSPASFVPLNIWITRSYLWRNVLGCLSDDFEITHNSIEGLFILHKLVKV
jgi:hypothetical protein